MHGDGGGRRGRAGARAGERDRERAGARLRRACSATTRWPPDDRAHGRRRRVLRARGQRGRAERAAGVGAPARLALAVVGSGSNLLVADEGVAGLVVKLDRRAGGRSRLRGRESAVGGGVRLPAWPRVRRRRACRGSSSA